MSKKWIFGGFVVFALIVLMGVVVYQQTRKAIGAPLLERELSDTRTLVVYHASFGFRDGVKLGARLPNSIWLGDTALGVFAGIRNEESGRWEVFSPGSMSVSNRNGVEYDHRYSFDSISYAGGILRPDLDLVCFRFSRYPRDESVAIFHLYDELGALLSEFEFGIPESVRVTREAWISDELPAEVHRDEVVTRVVATSKHAESIPFVPRIEQRFYSAHGYRGQRRALPKRNETREAFVVTAGVSSPENDASQWRLRRATLEDALGNPLATWNDWGYVHRPSNRGEGLLDIAFYGVREDLEVAKLHLEWTRKLSATFRTDEISEAVAMEFPAAGAIHKIEKELSAGNTRARIVFSGGPSTVVFDHGDFTSSTPVQPGPTVSASFSMQGGEVTRRSIHVGRPYLLVEFIAPAPSDSEVNFLAEFESGEIRSLSWGTEATENGGIYRFDEEPADTGGAPLSVFDARVCMVVQPKVGADFYLDVVSR